MNVKDIIVELQHTSSTNKKVEILKREKDNQLFKEVLVATYDKSLNYFVRKFDQTKQSNKTYSLEATIYSLVNELNTRKVTGNEAISLVEEIYAGLSDDNKFVFLKIIDRDLECGASITTINKAIPNLIPDPKKLYMRCSIFNEKDFYKFYKNTDTIYLQEKMDGVYVNLVYEKGQASFTTRNLKPLKLWENQPDIFTPIIKGFKDTDNMVIQGELLIKDKVTGDYLPRELGNGLLNSKNKVIDITKYEVVLVAWDCLPVTLWKGREKETWFYKERFQYLIDNIDYNYNIKVVNYTAIHNHDKVLEAIHTFYKGIVNNGGEGIVIKHPYGIWEGKTSKYQMKYKREIEVDLRVSQVLDGKSGKRKGKKSILTCENDEKTIKVNVGTGFTDDFLEFLDKNWEEIIRKVVTIKCFDLIKADDSDVYSLFLPRFIEIREDKNETDTLKRVNEMKGV